MTRSRDEGLADLEARIGHAFADPALLGRALTHVSASPARRDSYERLEFLGDRVLGLAVAHMLYDAFPNESEGELSRRLAALVRKETCAEVAEVWGVGAAMRLGEGEAQTGGRGKRALLGDICEAIIGAAFLDGGAAAAEHIVRKAFSDRMAASGQDLRDAKTALQEWAQARGLATPRYQLVARSGPDHAPFFEVVVEVQGFAAAPGSGASKRVAEQAAAAAFLAREDAAKGKGDT
ncbi:MULTISPECIES: ribonuclease III [Methylocystis]|jgi:ribonuclease-3|uniref:ribonuclease III n=1 Tax=Methylocystis TaxID=133 RepID=UPI00210A189D|nr:ribonuclease III [Methylocystis suflitae]MCQ4188481.1 ribonuclease III [Methylocystis suflitae]